ncbi:MAG TPA: acetyl-CoA C-acetyltransferase [Candidatus Polarisedimenticolia bacterium]|nr:acetyl-CoA C-acetyltransferase [Candidatus Polarisedimenticolia bacterium]
MRKAVIAGSVRTPVGRFLGTLKGLPATDLGARVVKETLRRAGVSPETVGEVIMGNVVSAGLGQNPARQAALGGGLPPKVGAMTINKVCGSGLKSVVLATQAVLLGDQEVVVAGGMESMSNAPYLLTRAREGYRMGNDLVIDSMIHDGLWDAYENYHMGCTGENVAKKYDISRRAQDEYAVNSHRKAVAAIDAGKFKKEIVVVEILQKKGAPPAFDTDEGPRRDTSLEALSKLKPAFAADGTVTAGNAPGVNDGASAMVVLSDAAATRLGVKPQAEVVAYATSGVEPAWVMMAPLGAVEEVLRKTGWKRDEVDLYEMNEAFSVQAVALIRELKLPPDRVNVHGGAVALGHPIGASGARILTTLIHALRDRGGKRGIAALCLGGGNAVAMAIQAL